LQELGDLMDNLGEYDFAMSYYIDAFEVRRNRLGLDDDAVAETLYSMGYIDRDSGGGLRQFIYWDPHVNPSSVADAHLSNPPMSIKYAIVVPRESVDIAFRITAIDNIDVAADILNTYPTSPCDEKVWTILGPEFGPELEVKRANIVRSL
jgi:hypothetical protein